VIERLHDIRSRLQHRLAAVRSRFPWLDHLNRAGNRYVEQRGNHFAAAVTFFSLVAAVPLLMIAFGVAGYVLALKPSWFIDLEEAITEAVPAAAADAVLPIVAAAVAQRDTVAGIGLLGAVWAGIWWMSNLREAVSAQWRLPPLGPTSVRRVLLDLVALGGLALALVCSLSGSIIAMGIAEGAVRATGMAGGEARILLATAGLLVGVSANWVVLLWITARLPRVTVPWRDAAGAALLGAVGISVLELSVTAFFGSVTATPGGAVFGSLLGVLLFTYLVSRFVLLVTAWAATAHVTDPAPVPVPVPLTVPQLQRSAERSIPRADLMAVVGALLAGLLVGVTLRRRQNADGPDRSGRQPNGPGGRRRSTRP
jgi:membrane protein